MSNPNHTNRMQLGKMNVIKCKDVQKTELKKEELKKIPVWVKMHDVPLAAYTEDGLSLIASKIGVPKVLDNETAKMCTESWGRSGFARAIIELDAEKETKDNIMIAIPNVEDGGILKSNIRVEYEWKPPRCNTCKVFGHTVEDCPKVSVDRVDTGNKGKNKVDDQGFQYGNNRKKVSKQQYHVKEKPKVIYKPKKINDRQEVNKPSSSRGPTIEIKNAFSGLNGVHEEEETDVEEVRLASDEGMPTLMKEDSGNKTGASTPAEKVTNG
ncbi:uncharacterized protein LOC110888171 [Helianthus annuus]|uniref:uncharacterized protein LOC110888171 n=1 Tax=Helianthus annuus TaxID=4232 RepID=UPI000B8F058C|nr:uncharacterized protein LOC110888171 [Helianthus annuus]